MKEPSALTAKDLREQAIEAVEKHMNNGGCYGEGNPSEFVCVACKAILDGLYGWANE